MAAGSIVLKKTNDAKQNRGTVLTPPLFEKQRSSSVLATQTCCTPAAVLGNQRQGGAVTPAAEAPSPTLQAMLSDRAL